MRTARADRSSGVVAEAGDLAWFAGATMRNLAGGGHYFSEVLRQSARLVTGTTLVIVGLVMIVGGECGLFGVYVLRPLGATSFTGLGTALCGVREMWPYMFAYVFAAKVGCGLVAEIGSMRISDEIDALDVIAVPPMRYLIAPRLLAVWITVPPMYIIAMLFGTFGSFLVVCIQLGDVSLGQWATLHFASQSLLDNAFSLLKVLIFATTIAIVGLYYGYRARGGPVGVGAATARSMVVNLVLIHVIGTALTTLFWGTNARATIGG